MTYQWTKELETGNSTIDSQHRQLIDQINMLLDACAGGQGRSMVSETMDFLNRYIIKHFDDEEKMQIRYEYPDYPNHKKYHEEFKKVVSEIQRDLVSDGPTIPIVARVNSSIAGWLISHIKREDVRVAEHIKSKTAT